MPGDKQASSNSFMLVYPVPLRGRGGFPGELCPKEQAGLDVRGFEIRIRLPVEHPSDRAALVPVEVGAQLDHLAPW